MSPCGRPIVVGLKVKATIEQPRSSTRSFLEGRRGLVAPDVLDCEEVVLRVRDAAELMRTGADVTALPLSKVTGSGPCVELIVLKTTSRSASWAAAPAVTSRPPHPTGVRDLVEPGDGVYLRE